MTRPLQFISKSVREKKQLSTKPTREKPITVIYQQKERVSPPRASPFNYLAPGKKLGNQNEEWTIKITYCY